MKIKINDNFNVSPPCKLMGCFYLSFQFDSLGNHILRFIGNKRGMNKHELMMMMMMMMMIMMMMMMTTTTTMMMMISIIIIMAMML